jgi:hypothetical protein
VCVCAVMCVFFQRIFVLGVAPSVLLQLLWKVAWGNWPAHHLPLHTATSLPGSRNAMDCKNMVCCAVGNCSPAAGEGLC